LPIPPASGGCATCAKHVIVVGLGSFGSRVVADLTAAGYDVAVIELDENNRFLSSAADLDVPVIFGDGTLRQTLESAGVVHARAIAVLTQDDMVNVEAGIVLREILGPRVLPEVIRPDVPVVLRVYDRALGAAVAQRFGFENVRSTVELAAPWFIGAAMGLQVLGDVFGRAALLHGRRNARGGRQRTRWAEDVRAVHPHPRHRDHQAGQRPSSYTRAATPGFVAATTVYLVGPYRELLATLRKGQPPREPAADDERASA